MKLKLAVSLLILLGLGGSLRAQSLTNPQGGNLTASSTNCSVAQSCIWMKLPLNSSTISVTVSGTFSETLTIEQSGDGGNNFATVTAVSAVGLYSFNVGGMTDFRVRCSAFTSGSAGVNLQAGSVGGGGSGGAGSAASGNGITNAFWVTPNDFVILDITPVTAQTNAVIGLSFRLQDATGHITQTTPAATTFASLAAAGPNFIGYQVTTSSAFLVGVMITPMGPLQQWQPGDWNLNVWLNNSPSGNPCPTTSTNCLTNPVPGIPLFGGPAAQFYTTGWSAASGVVSTLPCVVSPNGCVVFQTQTTTPAAGAECAVTPSVNYRTKLDSMLVKLVTSATAANRVVNLNLVASGSSVLFSPSPISQTASTTTWYSFMPGAGMGGAQGTPPGTSIAGGGIIGLPLPNYIAMSGAESSRSIGTASSGLQATDQYTCILRVEITNDDD